MKIKKILKILFVFLKENCIYYLIKLKSIEIIQNNFLEDKFLISNDVIKEAKEIINDNRLNLLGINFVKDYKWNKDFKNGYIWSKRYYKLIKTINKKNDSDIKIPWELSRLHNLFVVAQAYKYTNDDNYSKHVIEKIYDWIYNNRYLYGVNWKCAMDVSIRSVNLIYIIQCLKNSSSYTQSFSKNINRILYLHGRYIYNNLEKFNETGNHYMSNLMGLIYIGVYFNGSNVDTKKWLDFSVDELCKEVKVQFNNDGTNYETSTTYHRLVLEMVLLSINILNKNNIKYDKTILPILENACEFIMDITNDNGYAPLIGDNDNGRILILGNYLNEDKSNLYHILAIAGEMFNRDDFRYCGKKYKEVTSLILNIKNKNISEDIVNKKSKMYNDGGYYILRNDDIFTVIRCGELAFRGKGTHSHNDQLSFILDYDNVHIIIDPGTYVYTSNFEMRNKYRSTNMHNTIEIDFTEQNTINPYKLFELKEETFSEMIYFDKDKFEGKHWGYKKKFNIVINRKININNNILYVEDFIDCEFLNNNVLSYLILDENLKYEKQNENSIIFINYKNKIKVEFCFYDNKFWIEEEIFSRQYGIKEKTNKIVIKYLNKKNKYSIKMWRI